MLSRMMSISLSMKGVGLIAKLYQDDCLEIMNDIKDNSIDMILADPPYGITACKWDSVIPLVPMWLELKRIIKPNGAIVLMASQPFTSALVMSNPKMFKYCWVWDKKLPSGAVNCNRMPLKRHEDICVFYSKPPTYNPIMRTGILRKKGGAGNGAAYGHMEPKTSYNDQYYPTTLLEFSNANLIGRQHPTQKPVALMEYLINTYTNKGETVLDFCMGSGTTGVACYNLNRNFIGIELDVEYFKLAEERINNNAKQLHLSIVSYSAY